MRRICAISQVLQPRQAFRIGTIEPGPMLSLPPRAAALPNQRCVPISDRKWVVYASCRRVRESVRASRIDFDVRFRPLPGKDSEMCDFARIRSLLLAAVAALAFGAA